MLHYLVRDIGMINELEAFMSSSKPTKESIDALSRQFPEIPKPTPNIKYGDGCTCISDNDVLSFPHLVTAIIGHGGSGKSTILKHLANRQNTMFCAPTNAAGINLQNLCNYSLTLTVQST